MSLYEWTLIGSGGEGVKEAQPPNYPGRWAGKPKAFRTVLWQSHERFGSVLWQSHYRKKRARYSAASTNPSTMRRESDGFASSATIQFRYKASGSRCKYPKYSITTNAWL